MTTRLTWTPTRHTGFSGRAAGIELFTIHYRNHRSEPAYFMRSALPGAGFTWRHDEVGALKHNAERVLADWLACIDPPQEAPAPAETEIEAP